MCAYMERQEIKCYVVYNHLCLFYVSLSMHEMEKIDDAPHLLTNEVLIKQIMNNIL